MADHFNGDTIPESTYHFSAEFEPSHLCNRIFYITMVCIAAFVLMLIIDNESVDEDDFCDRTLETSTSEADNHGGAFKMEDRGCQSPRMFASYGDYYHDEEKMLDRPEM